MAHLHMAESCEALGNVTEAREHCAKASRRFSLIGFEQGIADVDRVYARIASRQNRWEVAERYLRHAISVYDDHGDQLNLAESHEELAALLETVGEGAQAANELRRSKILYASLHGNGESSEDASPGG